MYLGQIILLSLVVLTWLVGGNILIAYHYKRIGKPWHSGFKPFAFPFMKFNMKETLILSSIAILSFIFLIMAIYWPI